MNRPIRNPCRTPTWTLCVLVGTVVVSGCASTTTPDPAAAPPATDIWLIELAGTGERLELVRPENVTARPGYDNQPGFSPDGRTLYYTEIDGGQADPVAYDLASGERRHVARTPESEYSPTPIPRPGGSESADRADATAGALSVVRVEPDGRQRLWRVPLAGGEPTLLLRNVEPVGYHAWVGGRSERLVLFVLGEPPTLEVVEVATGRRRTVAENVGRAIQPLPEGAGGGVAFIRNAAGDGEAEGEAGTILRLDPASGVATPLARALPGSQDFAVAPDGALWMASGTRLFRLAPGASEWREVGDVAAFGIGALSRLAVHPDGKRLAIVAEE